MPGTSSRPDANYIYSIDGLRAIAVLLVVFFHAGFRQFEGGFVGVDVFYVISGYLITLNIIAQREAGSFSFGRFYQRRLARLFPALLTVILATLVAGYFILSPEDLKRIGQTAIYATLSFSNIFFWLEAGYFDRASEVKPLLHTWSLSVEEQFYLVWPALLGLLFWLGKRRAVIFGLIGLSLLSLGAALYAFESSPGAVFFLTPFRVYQFGIGSLIALTGLCAYQPNKSLLVFPSVVGLLLLGYTIDGTTHILLSAILPALFAGAFIIGARSPSVQRVFASSVLVWIGQRSYSIYLVHWPLMVLWKINTDYTFSVAEKWAAIGLSILLGWVLHGVVEQRFRFHPAMAGGVRYRIATATLVMSMVNITIASHMWGTGGYPERLSGNLQAYAADLKPRWATRKMMVRDGICNLTIKKYQASDYDVDTCLVTDPEKPNWLVLGDSFGSGVYAIFARAYPDIHFTQLTIPGCLLRPPNRIQGDEMCDNLQRRIYDHIRDTDDLDGVVISSNWQKGHIYVVREIVSTLQKFNKKVIVINQRMVFKDRLPAIVASSASVSGAKEKAITLRVLDNIEVRDSIEEQLADRVAVVDLMNLQCAGQCEIFDNDGNLIYLDDSHFSPEGIAYISGRLKAAYDALLD